MNSAADLSFAQAAARARILRGAYGTHRGFELRRLKVRTEIQPAEGGVVLVIHQDEDIASMFLADTGTVWRLMNDRAKREPEFEDSEEIRIQRRYATAERFIAETWPGATSDSDGATDFRVYLSGVDLGSFRLDQDGRVTDVRNRLEDAYGETAEAAREADAAFYEAKRRLREANEAFEAMEAMFNRLNS